MTSVVHDITDVGSASELLRYATRAQLQLVNEHAGQNTIATAIGMSESKRYASSHFSHVLKDGILSDDKLHKLDEVVVALASPKMVHVGGLSSLAIRLRGLRDRESLAGRVPPAWTREILLVPAGTEFDVLTQASALLSAFLAAESVQRADRKSRALSRVLDRYHDEILRVVDQLILVGVAPPTPRSVEALIMLGTLGSYAFDIMKRPLTDALHRPLGFRVWRAISKLVKLRTQSSPHTINNLKNWVEELLGEAEQLRSASLYPGRSLDLELALVIPAEWSPNANDWVGAALRARAYNSEATIRERGTAAMGLWQRAMLDNTCNPTDVAHDLAPLIHEFESAQNRPDAARGMEWVAATLKHVIQYRVPVCNDWPELPEQPAWLRHVNEAISHLERQGIPEPILPGTRTLFRHVLLQNAGVHRRQAIETLLAGGWTEPVTSSLERFINVEMEESWIRLRALFALGFLQRPDRGVANVLRGTAEASYQNLLHGPTRAQVMEMHATFFAIGDCFGAAGISNDSVLSIREQLRPMLTRIVNDDCTNKEDLYPVARAAAYLLTFTAQPRKGSESKDIAEELLERLREHPDKVTRDLSFWALKFRFDEGGAIRSLI